MFERAQLIVFASKVPRYVVEYFTMLIVETSTYAHTSANWIINSVMSGVHMLCSRLDRKQTQIHVEDEQQSIYMENHFKPIGFVVFCSDAFFENFVKNTSATIYCTRDSTKARNLWGLEQIFAIPNGYWGFERVHKICSTMRAYSILRLEYAKIIFHIFYWIMCVCVFFFVGTDGNIVTSVLLFPTCSCC